ncbi:MAG: efflux RND transporter periplasmic adaptor subunit [Pseudomonadota bacterium]
MGEHFAAKFPFAVIGLAALLVLPGCGEESQTQASAPPPPPAVTVAEPIVRDVIEDDEYVGRFEAIEAVDVRARIGGYLEDTHFTEGAFIEAGDLLFTIDRRPFETTLNQVEAQLRIAETQLEFAEAQLQRAEELVGRGNIPVATLDERRQEFLAAQAAVEGGQAEVARARLDLEYTEIRAPISGRIDRRRVTPGNLVQADATVLTTIVSLDPIDFYFDIDERSLLVYAANARARGETLQEGGGDTAVQVSITDDEIPPFDGQLNFAENRLDAETGTLRVRARFDNPDFVLQPGLFGRINVPGSLPYRGVLIPDEAIVADQNRQIVYVLTPEDTAEPRIVRPGPRLFGYRVIRDGLEGDERVIINGLLRVRPGAPVTPERVDLPPERS